MPYCMETYQKKGRMAVITSDEGKLSTKKITRDKHYIMLKGSTYEKDIAILTMYASNKRVSKSVKKNW